MSRNTPPPEDFGPDLFARKMGEDAGKQARPRGRKRLDARFAAYLVGQISSEPPPAPALAAARYQASARDLSRPRAGIFADEQA